MIKDTRTELVKGTGLSLNFARCMPAICRLDLIALDGYKSLEMLFITESRNGKNTPTTDISHRTARNLFPWDTKPT